MAGARSIAPRELLANQAEQCSALRCSTTFAEVSNDVSPVGALQKNLSGGKCCRAEIFLHATIFLWNRNAIPMRIEHGRFSNASAPAQRIIKAFQLCHAKQKPIWNLASRGFVHRGGHDLLCETPPTRGWMHREILNSCDVNLLRTHANLPSDNADVSENFSVVFSEERLSWF